MTITAAHWKKSFYCWLCFCGLLPRYQLLVYLQFLCSWCIFPSLFWNCSLFLSFTVMRINYEFFLKKNCILFQVFLDRKFDYFWNYGKLHSDYLKSFCLHYYLSETLIRYLLDHLPPFFHDALIMYSYILHLFVSMGCIWIVVFNSCYLNLISISWCFQQYLISCFT